MPGRSTLPTSALAEVLAGTPIFVDISVPGDRTGAVTPGTEVSLTAAGPFVVASLEGTDGGPPVEWPTRAPNRAEDEKLSSLVGGGGGGGAVVALVDDRRPTTVRGTGSGWMSLRVHRYGAVHTWPTISAGMDDRVLEAVRRFTEGRKTPTQAAQWLASQVLLPPAPGTAGPSRVVAVVEPGSDLSSPTPCWLRGQNFEFALEVRDGVWRISRVRRAGGSHDVSRLALIRGDVGIVDTSIAGRLRADMRARVRRLDSATPDESFVVRWREYQRLDDRLALRRVRDLGYLAYSRWTRRDGPGDVIRFFLLARADQAPLSDGQLLEHLGSGLATGEGLDLETSERLPGVFGGAEPDAGLLDHDLDRRLPAGEVIAVAADGTSIDLRMRAPGRTLAGVATNARVDDPPHAGFLFASFRGDYRRLRRRQRAFDQVRQGRLPIPQLLGLLEGEPRHGHPRPHVAPMSDAARACFPKGPTEAQILAMDVALNTPDVAVIQGPPGTGKTQLISALQVRLAEEGRGHAVVSRSMLLTSFQHAAVDNLIERSRVWDLPAIKVDAQDRGSTFHVDQWRLRSIEALDQELAGTEPGRYATAASAVIRRAAAYCMSPVAGAELAALITEVRADVADLLPVAVLDRLDRLHATVQAARTDAGASPRRRQSLLRAVRGLRTRPESFLDDGPLMADRLLLHLHEIDDLDPAVREPIERAADWTGAALPPFLAELDAVRAGLLAGLRPDLRALVAPEQRDDVVSVLDEVAAALRERLSASPHGAEAALVEYRDELRGDPEAVEATLRLYTTSLGATCQQADSPGMRDAKDGAVLFDTVIVDEAARANPLDLLIPLTLAVKRIILVGDHKQLPHMLEPDIEHELRLSRQEWSARLAESVFERLYSLLDRDTEGRRRAARLNAQFRMHPALGDFVSRTFYDGTLASPDGAAKFVHGLPDYRDRPAAWVRVPRDAGPEVRSVSVSRPAEARWIARELRRVAMNRPDLTFGVISFYRAQATLIWNELVTIGLATQDSGRYAPVEALRHDDRGGSRERLHVGTVDAFQGKQFDVVFLSLTRCGPPPAAAVVAGGATDPAYSRWVRRSYGHLVMLNRLCVAMSRQQRLLVAVGDDEMFRPGVAPAEVSPVTDLWRLCDADVAGTVLEPVEGGLRAAR